MGGTSAENLFAFARRLSDEYARTRPTDMSAVLERHQAKFDALVERWDRIPPSDRPTALAQHVGCMPRREHRDFLLAALKEFEEADRRGFDAESSRQRYQSLSSRVVVYRGTHSGEIESREFGLFWTLDQTIARWVAIHGTHWMPRASWEKPAVVMARVRREDIRVFTADELVLHPDALTIIGREFPQGIV